jgi:hypothetical protein
MKKGIIILSAFVLIAGGCGQLTQKNKNQINILYSLQDTIMETYIDTILYYCEDDTSAVIQRQYFVDTLFFDHCQNFKLYLWRDTVFFNNEVIYHFNGKNLSFLSFEQIAYMDYKGKKYLYLYPQYFEINGPYMWYELGVLITFDNRKFSINEQYDYFDNNEFDKIFEFNKSYLQK